MLNENAVAIYVVDPGGTTGVAEALINLAPGMVKLCMKRAHAKGNIRTYEVKGDHTEQGFELNKRMTEFFYRNHVERGIVPAKNLFIVVEDFQLRLMGADLSPVKVTAAYEMLLAAGHGMFGAWQRDNMYMKQMPSVAMSFCNDDMLKRWHLWRGKSDHERDVIRHLAARIDKLLQGR